MNREDKPESVEQFMFRELLDAKSAEKKEEWYLRLVTDEVDVGPLIYGVLDDYKKWGNITRIEMLISVIEGKIHHARKPSG